MSLGQFKGLVVFLKKQRMQLLFKVDICIAFGALWWRFWTVGLEPTSPLPHPTHVSRKVEEVLKKQGNTKDSLDF